MENNAVAHKNVGCLIVKIKLIIFVANLRETAIILLSVIVCGNHAGELCARPTHKQDGDMEDALNKDICFIIANIMYVM